MKSVEGLSQYDGQSLQVDGIGEAGYSILNGKSVNLDGTPFVDDRSGRQVTTRTIVATMRINTVPNIVAAGQVSGMTYTYMTGFLHDFAPWWPIQ